MKLLPRLLSPEKGLTQSAGNRASVLSTRTAKARENMRRLHAQLRAKQTETMITCGRYRVVSLCFCQRTNGPGHRFVGHLDETALR